MEDSMDKFSIPRKKTESKLGILFELEPRRAAGKAGRELAIPFDARFPLINGFALNYLYYVRFLELGNIAGNHYHIKKQELMVPLQGKFKIALEDIKTKEQESVFLSAEENKVFYVKNEIAHSVKSLEPTGVLLVLASSPNNMEDEFEYKVNLK